MPGSDIFKILDYAEGYDKIYCSMTARRELDYLRPVLDKRWVLGGPLIHETNIDLNVPCEATKKFVPEYFGVSDHDYTYYSTYFDRLMKLYPKRRAMVHAYVGGTCSWNKCTFCKFDRGRRPPLFGDDLIKFLENTDKSKSYTFSHLATSELLPEQLRTVLKYSPKKKNWLATFLRSDDKTNKVLREFNNDELRNVLIYLGVEATSETIRNGTLNKNLKDEDIYETLEHIVRVGGSLEILMMSNFFSTTKECVKESKKFVEKLEKIVPPEKFRPNQIDDRIQTRWPLRTKEWLKSLTNFEIRKEYDPASGQHYKVIIPKNSDVYKYNKEIAEIYNNAKFNTNETDMYMGDPNE